MSEGGEGAEREERRGREGQNGREGEGQREREGGREGGRQMKRLRKLNMTVMKLWGSTYQKGHM